MEIEQQKQVNVPKTESYKELTFADIMLNFPRV